jgi:hypothetical protein
MTHATSVLAATSWPDAAVAIAGVALVTAVALMVIQQTLATWRTRIVVAQEEAYRRLAEQTAQELHELNARLGADRDRQASTK